MEVPCITVERLGLTLVSPPRVTVPTVNIVFVHGLRGNPKKTWHYKEPSNPSTPKPGPRVNTTQSSKSSGNRFFSKLKKTLKSSPSKTSALDKKLPSDQLTRNVFWLAEVLPVSVPDANIWTYGYNANVVDGLFQAHNKNSMLQHGNDLVVKLCRRLRDKEPIIFVAHSLGGLLVKVAVAQMQRSLNQRQKKCFKRIKAIIFCGTPHKGSNAAAWGSLASNLVSMAFTDTNSKLLADLQVNSEVLDSIQQDFFQVLHSSSILVHSFQEGRAMSGIKGMNSKVVDDISSKCGWPLETVETIDADHRQMVKKPGVKPITDVLRDMERQILSQAGVDMQEADEVIDEAQIPYMYLDRFYTVNYHDGLSQVSPRHPNTCSWLMDTPEVRDWLSGASHNLLWLHGYPGLGKSVFARYLVESLGETNQQFSQNKDRSIIIFFFCSYRAEESRSVSSLVSSLIHQLVLQDPALAKPIERKFTIIEKLVLGSLRTLWDILLDVINAITKKTLYIVIDALDELLAPSWSSFLDEFLQLMSKSSINSKAVITSRPEPEILRILEPQSTHLNLAKRSKNRSDVSAYLTDTIMAYGRENSFGEAMSEKILSEINVRADGMFLWAKLAWSYFIDGVGTWSALILKKKLHELQRLPPGMDILYHRILTSTDKRLRPDLIACFVWIVTASRPLTITELSIALALRDRPRHVKDIDVRLNMRSFFKKCCPNLIRVNQDDSITLVHQSFKDFLLQAVEVVGPNEKIKNEFWINIMSANLELGLDCLTYLGLEDFHRETEMWRQRSMFLPCSERWVVKDNITQRYPFLAYAMEYWPQHLRHLDHKDGVWPYFALTLRAPDRRMRWSPFEPAIFYLCRHKLRGLLKHLAERRFDIDEMNGDGHHVIHTAFEYGSMEDIELLLSLGADINGRNARGETLLQRLVSYGNVEKITEWLGRTGVNPNVQNSDGQTSLHVAVRAEGAVQDIVDSLLAVSGIDANVIDKEGRTPLSLAIHWGRKRATLKLLQCSSVDARVIGQDGSSPIINAIMQGWSDVAFTILGKLTSVDAFRDASGRTTLHWTIMMNMPDLLKAALDKQDAIINTVDHGSRTALHVAAEDGMIEAVDLLLRQGALTTIQTRSHETALHLAVTKGHFGVVKLLVKHMPAFAINSKDYNGWTALHRGVGVGLHEMTKWMLQQDAVSLTPRDKHGRRAISFAAAFGSLDVLRVFLERSPDDIFFVDSFGYNLLHMAAFASNRMNVHFLLSFNHLKPDKENHWGKRPLDISPNSFFSQFLYIEGFTHSKTYIEQQEAIRRKQLKFLEDPEISPSSGPICSFRNY